MTVKNNFKHMIPAGNGRDIMNVLAQAGSIFPRKQRGKYTFKEIKNFGGPAPPSYRNTSQPHGLMHKQHHNYGMI